MSVLPKANWKGLNNDNVFLLCNLGMCILYDQVETGVSKSPGKLNTLLALRNQTLLVKQHRPSPTDNILQTITVTLWESGSVITHHWLKPAAEI